MLTVSNSTIVDNVQYGIVADADETLIENTTIANHGQFGLDVEGPLRVVGSTLINNVGYGISANFSDPTPDTIENTTMIGNGFGAILSPGSELRNVTIVDNVDLGLLVDGSITIYNTVIAGNPADCEVGAGEVVDGDHNADSDGSCEFSGPGDLAGVDPMLGSLADNGGPNPPARTHTSL